MLAHVTLTAPATDLLYRMLEGHGNTLSEDHRTALAIMMNKLTEYALGKHRGRLAFGLGTGLGKTTAIVAWVATLAKLGVEDIGVAVTAHKVEALCSLKRMLMAQGVPEERIGLVHSYACDEVVAEQYLKGKQPLPDKHATLPSTSDNEERQVVLVSHQKVRRTDDAWGAFNTFRGRTRALMLWDESLVTSDAEFFDVRGLQHDWGKFEEFCDEEWLTGDLLPELRDYLSDAVARVTEAQERAAKRPAPYTLSLPDLSRDDARVFRAVLKRKTKVGKPMMPLVDLAGATVRIHPLRQGGLLRYTTAIPEELTNIIVFDASYPIRTMLSLDKTIRNADQLSEAGDFGVKFGALKSHRNVTVHQMAAPGGRGALSKDFHRAFKLAADVVEVVKAVPLDESILIFTFNHRSEEPDMPSALRFRLQNAGIQLEVEGRTRVFIETWGNETSLNQYAHCRHVILAGVLRMDQQRLGAAHLGQQDNLEAPLSDQDVHALDLGEVAHAIYQAASRGTMRTVRDGEADTMHLWFVTSMPGIKDHLDQVMPGATWEPWFGKYYDGGKVDRIAALMVELLDELAAQGDETVSMKMLRPRLLERLNESLPEDSTTLRKARDRALILADQRWVYEGRSFILVTAQYYGFEVESLELAG